LKRIAMTRLPGERAIPQYQRLAGEIRDKVRSGFYKSGDKLPAEQILAKSSNLSLLTVRQALGLLEDEGLLERCPGRGTFVSELNFLKAAFNIGGLEEKASLPSLKVRILETKVKRAKFQLAVRLQLEENSPVGFVKRIFCSGDEAPFLLQEGYIILDPYRPIVEAELDSSFFLGILGGGSARGLVRTAHVNMNPGKLGLDNASLLQRGEGDLVFELEYIFYDSFSKPLAAGLFIAPEGVLTFSSTMGVPLSK
jgi:GntR family transcriptional regulator